MKKAIFILLSMLAVVAAPGQINKVQTVRNLLKSDNKELDQAKTLIDAAVEHSGTKKKATTWYLRGQVYYNIYLSKDAKISKLDPNPLKQSCQSFLTAKSLDKNKQYEKKLIFEINRHAINFFNKGSEEYDQKKYDQALESYEIAMEIGQLPYINRLDTQLIFNAALAAEANKQYDKAIKYYSKAIELNYDGAELFHYLATVYLKCGDSISAFNTYKAGIQKVKDNDKLYLDVINFYLSRKDMENAFPYMTAALEKDTANASLWVLYGRAIEDKNKEEAIRAYKKVIEIDSTNFNGYYYTGTVYFNQGVEASRVATKIPLSKHAAYKAAMASADDYFKQALPFFEKAFMINREDQQLLTGLSQIYYRFKMEDKLAIVKKQIDRLK